MDVPHYVYIAEITIPGLALYKIGYSAKPFRRIRALANIEKPSSDVYGLGLPIPKLKITAIASFPNIQLAKVYEGQLHRKYKMYKYKLGPVLANGNSELFTYNMLRQEQLNTVTKFTLFPVTAEDYTALTQAGIG